MEKTLIKILELFLRNPCSFLHTHTHTPTHPHTHTHTHTHYTEYKYKLFPSRADGGKQKVVSEGWPGPSM